MASATSCTIYIGIVVLPEEASSAYVRVVMIFASKNPCTHVTSFKKMPKKHRSASLIFCISQVLASSLQPQVTQGLQSNSSPPKCH